MAGRNVFRRKRYIIKTGLQFRYIGVIFALAFITALITGYTVFATAWALLGERLADVYPQGRLIYVVRTTNLVLIRNLVFIASPLILILGLFFSHKTAGPIYRIEASLKEIINGDLTGRIRLRKGDELWDFAAIINEMIEKFSGSIGSNKKAFLELENDMAKIKKLIAAQRFSPQAIEPYMSDLQAKIEKIKTSLDSWKVTNPS